MSCDCNVNFVCEPCQIEHDALEAEKVPVLVARIRELEDYLHDQGMLGKDYFGRITKAKEILKDYYAYEPGSCDCGACQAIAALEGK